MNGFIRKSTIGHISEGLEVLAHGIVARCDRANGRHVMVIVDHDGTVYTPAADATFAKVWIDENAETLVGTYAGGSRRRNRVRAAEVIEDLRLRAREIGWVA